MIRAGTREIIPEILNHIAKLDEFKGAWQPKILRPISEMNAFK